MKNLLIFINPIKKFEGEAWGKETELLAKVQIDNSLGLGWKREDIMLITNFPYEHNGVKAIEVGDENFCPFSASTPSKIYTILTLFEQGLIKEDIYWFHDFDAFQLQPLNLIIPVDRIALTDYGITNISKGRNGRWSTGSLFFRKGSKDIFQWMRETIDRHQVNEEVALLALTHHNKHGIKDRIDKLNITYNFATRRRNIVEQYKITDLPIKVIHFHPFDKRPVFYLHTGMDNMQVCVHGKNPMGVLVTNQLKEIFKKYEIS